jgi:hypothetical protein
MLLYGIGLAAQLRCAQMRVFASDSAITGVIAGAVTKSTPRVQINPPGHAP